ncbi:hypothetical protein ACWEK5_44845 [Rhodococcus koreensis]
MNHDDSIAATSLDWSTVVLKESEPPPARPAEDGLLSVLLGIIVLSIGGTMLTAIPLLFAGATVVLAASADVEASFLIDHSDALWTLAGATTATFVMGGAAVGGMTAIGAVRKRRKPNEITGNQLAAAPDEVRELMSDAVLTIETIKESRAWRERLFTDLDLRAAIWDVGSRALVVGEGSAPADRAGIADPPTTVPGRRGPAGVDRGMADRKRRYRRRHRTGPRRDHRRRVGIGIDGVDAADAPDHRRPS